MMQEKLRPDPVVGEVHGYLTVSYGPIYVGDNRKWACKCSCGKETLKTQAEIEEAKLTNGGRCGPCTRKAAMFRHYGPAYSQYFAVRGRCTNPKHPMYPKYGGCGIQMCPRWVESYDNFIEDMKEPPEDCTYLVMVDENLGFVPNNCIWMSAQQKLANDRRKRQEVYRLERTPNAVAAVLECIAFQANKHLIDLTMLCVAVGLELKNANPNTETGWYKGKKKNYRKFAGEYLQQHLTDSEFESRSNLAAFGKLAARVSRARSLPPGRVGGRTVYEESVLEEALAMLIKTFPIEDDDTEVLDTVDEFFN